MLDPKNEKPKDAYEEALEKGYEVGIPGSDHEIESDFLDELWDC